MLYHDIYYAFFEPGERPCIHRKDWPNEPHPISNCMGEGMEYEGKFPFPFGLEDFPTFEDTPPDTSIYLPPVSTPFTYTSLTPGGGGSGPFGGPSVPSFGGGGPTPHTIRDTTVTNHDIPAPVDLPASGLLMATLIVGLFAKAYLMPKPCIS